MSKHYYQFLVVAVALCLILPCYGLIQLYNQSQLGSNDTIRFNFVTVEGPIQPIPTIANIDDDWVLLGKALFHSPLLSADNTISCASCHMVDFGGDDGFPVSTGVNSQKGTRNSPTILNAVFNFKQFWDGRANDLAEQASGPIHNPIEMNSNWPQIEKKLNTDEYFLERFLTLTGATPSGDNIIKALVTYQSSLVTPDSDFDRYIKGDKSALSKQQIYGYELFQEIGCSTCHQGINIGGNIFQKFGKLQQDKIAPTTDFGRFSVTNETSDKHVFKVPTLRNIALTSPYFHDGSVSELTDAVTIMARLQLGRDLTSRETQAIVALLHAFTGSLAEGHSK